MKHKDPASGRNKDSPDKKRQRLSSSPANSSASPSTSDSNSSNAVTGIFSGINVFVLQAGIGKARTELFKKQLKAKGACVQAAVDASTTHIIVDEEMTFPRFCRIMKYDEDGVPTHIEIIKARWLSLCLSDGLLVDHEEFKLPIVRSHKPSKLFPAAGIKQEPVFGDYQKQDQPYDSSGPSKNLTDTSSKSTMREQQQSGTSQSLQRHGSFGKSPAKKSAAGGYDSDDSNYVPSDDEAVNADDSDDDDFKVDDRGQKISCDGNLSSNPSNPSASPVKLPRGNWVCSRPSTSQKTNFNEHITEKLELLMKTYENTRDKWRALGYKKGISALRNYGKEVTTWEEANAIPGIGTKLADKIAEIIESGHLRKIDFVCKGEDMEAIDLFNNVWGAGPTVAREWVQQGFRTLDDLRGKAKLNKQQQIGLKHYDEFLDRMSRQEAGDIERTVRERAESLFPGMLAVVCGSYRRGKQTCGDVDVLISHPDGKSHRGALSKILDALRQTGFITDDLIRVEEKGEQKKYMGVCKLPGDNRKHRRIDIIVAPYSEYPCALVHFTGSGHFNRSMRALAKKKGMSLSEHALRAGVVRRGQEKIHEGSPLPVTCEQDIFTHLGLEYRQPHERDY